MVLIGGGGALGLGLLGRGPRFSSSWGGGWVGGKKFERASYSDAWVVEEKQAGG